MQRDKIKPILFSIIKHSSKEELHRQIPKDIVSGVVVAVVALPLSIALAIASGVGPEQGLYTAIVAGFLIAFLGGSRVQISGPTAAFATIVAGIVATDGMEGLVAATIIAGVMLVLMGLLKLGTLIRFVPYTITTGFTAGIAVTIVIGQIKDLLGLTYPAGTTTVDTTDKLGALAANISTVNWQAVLVGVVCLAILMLWPKVSKRIPGSLVAVIVGAAMVPAFGLQVNTIGDLYTIEAGLPTLQFPQLSLDLFRDELANGITIAILAAIESLLSCVVADSMISGAPPLQHGAGGAGRGQHGLGAVRRHPRHGRHRAYRRQREKRRPHAHRRHGACRGAAAGAGVPDALRRAHSHAHHRRYSAASRLQHVGLAQFRPPLRHRLARRCGNAAADVHADHRVRPGHWPSPWACSSPWCCS